MPTVRKSPSCSKQPSCNVKRTLVFAKIGHKICFYVQSDSSAAVYQSIYIHNRFSLNKINEKALWGKKGLRQFLNIADVCIYAEARIHRLAAIQRFNCTA